MYQQIKPTETFRERELALLEECQNRRLVLGRRLHAGCEPKVRSTIGTAVVGFVAALVVAGLMLAASGGPAHASTTFSVNLNSDEEDTNPGDGICDVSSAIPGPQCTLRAAIEESNATPGADVVDFDVPEGERDPSSGVATISPGSALPIVEETLTIDGYTQAGSSPNTLAKGTNAVLKVELDGTNAGDTSGTSGLSIGAQNSVVRGLVINRFAKFGINFLGSASGSQSEGNFIGTDPSGTLDEGNAFSGVGMTSNSNIVVGGTSPDKRNLISGNQGNGVTIFGFDVGGNNKVQGNLIGTDKNGTGNLGNGNNGVFILRQATNTIGGDSAVAANTIAFNGSVGSPNGSDGVAIFGESSTANRILSNSIFSNAGLGVDLVGPNEDASTNVSTANDLGDGDSGPNNLQNKPVLSSAKTVSGKTTIVGKLNSHPTETYTIQFFSNPSGNEGKKFIGQKSVTTDATSGNRSFTFSPVTAVSVGQTITATATNTSSSGDTSEFSAPKTVASS